ncbi:hypothetical protein AB9Q10_34165 [Streptomyces krungchingensis]|uniref:hypothetical protein n=1 Tax=Streptomyces krungchingensis TaxID=1565034 RepID=UPI003CE8FEC4
MTTEFPPFLLPPFSMDVISVTHRSVSQRLLMLTAPTALVAGAVLLPTSALAAPATPHSVSVTMNDQGAGHNGRDLGTAVSPAKWKEATDDPSGIAIKLPGKPRIQNLKTYGIQARHYSVRTSDGVMYFMVVDVKSTGPGDLKELVEGTRQGMAERLGGVAITSQKPVTMDGHTAVDAHMNSLTGKRMVITTRVVAVDDRVVQVVTVGPKAHEKAVDKAQAQAVASLRFP